MFREIIYAPIAQLVEQIPLKDKVPGSSPGGGTKNIFIERPDNLKSKTKNTTQIVFFCWNCNWF